MKNATQERSATEDFATVAPIENLTSARQSDNRFYREAVQTPALPVTGIANIATSIAAIMFEIGTVGESGENKFQNYKYMTYKDMFRKLTPLMGKHGLAVIPTEKSKNLFDNDPVVMGTYQFTLIHKSGEVWPFQPEWTGVSRARDSKGGFDDKALNKCATAAQKYFLKALFQIPSGEDDEDPDNHDGSVPGRRSPAERSRVPSPNDVAPQASADPERPQGPQLVKGGKDAASWTELYLEAMLTSGDRATVMQWIDANQRPLGRVSADLAKKISIATEKHLAFLSKTAPKSDPISSGPPPKTANGEMPNIQQYDDWIMWAVNKLGTTDVGDELNDFFESLDPFWADIKQPDREMLLGAKRSREDEQAP
jgi:hypothetical protein